MARISFVRKKVFVISEEFRSACFRSGCGLRAAGCGFAGLAGLMAGGA
jgi:hypothetical protein